MSDTPTPTPTRQTPFPASSIKYATSPNLLTSDTFVSCSTLVLTIRRGFPSGSRFGPKTIDYSSSTRRNF